MMRKFANDANAWMQVQQTVQITLDGYSCIGRLGSELEAHPG